MEIGLTDKLKFITLSHGARDSYEGFRKYWSHIFPVCLICMMHRETQTQLPGSIWPKGYLFANVNAIYPCHLIQEETEAQEGLQNEFVLVSFRMLLAVNNR